MAGIQFVIRKHISMLKSTLPRWADFNSDWYKETLSKVGHNIATHRKQWEVMSLLQALMERGLIGPGKRGLVFGVGQEWTVSYLAGLGCDIVATDLYVNSDKVENWEPSGQWCSNVNDVFYENFISLEDFNKRVSFRYVDMNNIPSDLTGFDFCWSLCALEHLGSLKHGTDFILNSVNCLKPGGWAFHSLEFDIDTEGPNYETVDNSFYKQRDIEGLAKEVDSRGWYLEPRDYSLGCDLNDYPDASGKRRLKTYSGGGFLVTSFSTIICKSKEPNYATS